jgi:hypothetical protein
MLAGEHQDGELLDGRSLDAATQAAIRSRRLRARTPQPRPEEELPEIESEIRRLYLARGGSPADWPDAWMRVQELVAEVGWIPDSEAIADELAWWWWP